MKRTPLRRVSRRRAGENRTYSALRREFLETRTVCEYPDCRDAATQVHHRRGRTGWLLLDVDHWTAICAAHHQHITEHPTEAYESGLSERRHSA